MKKILLVFIFIGSVVNQVKAQLGNVKGNAFEISSSSGTTTNNVMHKIWLLRNNDGDNWYTASLHDAIAVDVSFLNPQINTRAWWERNPNNGIQMWGDMAQTFMVLSGGNLGIGTSTPENKFTVRAENATVDIQSTADSQKPGLLMRYQNSSFAGSAIYYNTLDANTYFDNLYVNSAGTNYGSFNFRSHNEQSQLTSRLFLNGQNGNVGIGTTTPREKLSVNGNIRAREIKVEATNWPDYVFEENYNVGELEGLENYIKTNKHLPEIPSAKEVATNGVELGEMNKLLLKKIEELTLYVIELKKESLDQQKQLDQLKKNKKQ